MKNIIYGDYKLTDEINPYGSHINGLPYIPKYVDVPLSSNLFPMRCAIQINFNDFPKLSKEEKKEIDLIKYGKYSEYLKNAESLFINQIQNGIFQLWISTEYPCDLTDIGNANELNYKIIFYNDFYILKDEKLLYSKEEYEKLYDEYPQKAYEKLFNFYNKEYEYLLYDDEFLYNVISPKIDFSYDEFNKDEFDKITNEDEKKIYITNFFDKEKEKSDKIIFRYIDILKLWINSKTEDEKNYLIIQYNEELNFLEFLLKTKEDKSIKLEKNTLEAHKKLNWKLDDRFYYYITDRYKTYNIEFIKKELNEEFDEYGDYKYENYSIRIGGKNSITSSNNDYRKNLYDISLLTIYSNSEDINIGDSNHLEIILSSIETFRWKNESTFDASFNTAILNITN